MTSSPIEAGWTRMSETRKYAVVVEQGATSCGAYVPDLPGCYAIGATADEVDRLIRDAIQFHVDGLREEGVLVPEPCSITEFPEALS